MGSTHHGSNPQISGAGKLRFIQVVTKEAAAFMACAHAKFTGKWDASGTSGPGGIHLLNGLYDAKLDAPRC